MKSDHSKARVVALIEFNGMGHHPVWYRLFTKVLVERGYEVLGFCPDPMEMKQWADNTLSADFQKSCEFSYRGIRQLPAWIPVRVKPRVSSAIQYLTLAWALKRWEKRRQRKIDLVFFACIYDYAFEYFNDIARFFTFPVSGLYLHCRSIRMPGSPIPQSGLLPCLEKFWGHPPFLSLAVLDEGAQTGVQKLGNGRPVVWMPDVTTVNLPEANGDGIASKLKRYSIGQPITLILGHIQPTKGIELFCDVSDLMRGEDVCFGIIGDVEWSSFSPQFEEKLLRVAEHSSNVFAHFARVQDKDINACIAESDLIFAAYQSFPNSSNILSKAAQFRKPIIVSDGYLMAERVRKFRLGIVIPEGNVDAAEDAVRKLSGDTDSWIRENNPDWEGYLTEHSEQSLSEAFEEIVVKSLKCANP